MSQAVELIARRLKLSGLCGFDFILDSNRSAHLIDFNPRATQTCHLVSSDGKQLLVALAAKLGGKPLVDDAQRPQFGSFALFPHGFDLEPEKAHYCDVPNSPELVQLGREFSRRKHRLTSKVMRRMREKWF